MPNRKITRKSDKFVLIGAGFQGTAYCPNCHERLKEMKNDSFHLKCWECGERVPIKSVRFYTKPGEHDTGPSVVVQNRNWRRGKLGVKPRDPLAQELISKGFQVIDSDYRIPDPNV